MIRNILKILVIFFLINAMQPVFAQQVIIIVPSADVLKKGQIYTRVSSRFRPFPEGQFATLTPSVVYGITDTQEVFAAVSRMDFVNDVEPALDLAYKKIFNMTETTRWTLGGRMSTSLVSSIAPTNFLYTHIAQTIPLTKTRLTAGVYTTSPTEYFPDKPGVLLGLEQYIIPDKLQFNVDWISRNEAFGYMGAGFKIKPRKDWVIVTAILVPNGDKAKFGFLLFLGKIFR